MLENLIIWWEGFTSLQQIFLYAAIPATVILFLQTIFLLFGVGFGHATDHGEGIDDFDAPDFDSDGTDFEMDVPDLEMDVPDLEADIPDTGADGFDLEVEAPEFEFDGMQGEIDTPDVTVGGEPAEGSGGVYEPSGPEHDGAHHGSGVRILTVRGIVAFFAVGGWLGVAMLDIGLSLGISTLIAIIGGSLSLVLVAYAIKWSLSLQYSGNIQTKNAIDQQGEVYLKIPPKGKGKGKINLLLQERYVEMDAMTNGFTPLKVGQRVVVTGLIDQNTLLVEPAKLDLAPVKYEEVSPKDTADNTVKNN